MHAGHRNTLRTHTLQFPNRHHSRHNTMQLHHWTQRGSIHAHRRTTDAVARAARGPVRRPHPAIASESGHSRWVAARAAGVRDAELGDPMGASIPLEPPSSDRSHTTDYVIIGSGIGGEQRPRRRGSMAAPSPPEPCPHQCARRPAHVRPGLCCAALLARYGYSVTVCESHYLPGGAAHSFKVQGYKFDAGEALDVAARTGWPRAAAATADAARAFAAGPAAAAWGFPSPPPLPRPAMLPHLPHLARPHRACAAAGAGPSFHAGLTVHDKPSNPLKQVLDVLGERVECATYDQVRARVCVCVGGGASLAVQQAARRSIQQERCCCTLPPPPNTHTHKHTLVPPPPSAAVGRVHTRGHLPLRRRQGEVPGQPPQDGWGAWPWPWAWPSGPALPPPQPALPGKLHSAWLSWAPPRLRMLDACWMRAGRLPQVCPAPSPTGATPGRASVCRAAGRASMPA
jgi:hypothetical protein